MIKNAFFVLSLFFLFSVAFATPSSMDIHVDNNQDHFVISLTANPTTGYQWQLLTYDKTIITLTSSQYLKNNSLLGAGGTMVFEFDKVNNATWPKKTQLLFQYIRPWENKVVSPITVTVYFDEPT
jgi:inhibitor of cysteine peptidase